MKRILVRLSLLAVIVGNGSLSLIAQQGVDTLSQTILRLDSAFWQSYNNCDIEKFETFFTDDVEFYHDKGGITLGSRKLATSLKQNLCGNPNYKVLREAVNSSVKVFPLHNGSTIYGAILSGEHWFYAVEPAKAKRRTGGAKFTHLWLLNEGTWKMKRVLSYDHVPLSSFPDKKAISLRHEELSRFIGTYEGAKTGEMITKIKNGLLLLTINKQDFELHPESANKFFLKERDVVFEFVTKDMKVSRMIVRENGVIVEEAKHVSAK